MFDLDAKVKELAERGVSWREIERQLEAIATAAEKRAKQFERGKKAERNRAESELALVARIGRILFFLHHSIPAGGATAADHRLYDILARAGGAARPHQPRAQDSSSS